jgi:hypothetical protein
VFGRCRAAVADVFTAVPGAPVARPLQARRSAAASGTLADRLRTEVLWHPRRLAAACGATVLTLGVLTSPGLYGGSRGRPASAAPEPVAQRTLAPIPGNGASWLAVAREAAATCPGLPPAVLVAIGRVESGLGLELKTSSAGALGPMQFMPSTWAEYGVDGDGDGRSDVMDTVDAVHGAARLLCANGGADPDRLRSALWNYNHSDDYVGQVISLARSIPPAG